MKSIKVFSLISLLIFTIGCSGTMFETISADSTAVADDEDTTPPTVTVDNLTTGNQSPTITGTVSDGTLTVTVDSILYTDGDGNLTVTDKTWSLNIQEVLDNGTYDIVASSVDKAGNIGTDETTDELIVNTDIPVVTIDTLVTNDNTPTITGTVSAGNLTVTVDTTGYTDGDGNLSVTIPNWTLTIPVSLSDSIYDVVAVSFDAPNTGTDATTDELKVDTQAPTNQDAVFTSDTTEQGGVGVTIVDSGDSTNTIWFAPAGITTLAELNAVASTEKTSAAGDATSIDAPDDEGTYHVYVVDEAGNVSDASTKTLEVDNTPPSNQDAVFTANTTENSGTTIAINPSGEASVWFAPAGITTLAELNAVASSEKSTAAGDATSIDAPDDEGTYYMYVVDDAGNISAASSKTLEVDDSPPTNQDTVFNVSVTAQGTAAVTITASGEAAVWFAPAGTTITDPADFIESSTMTTAAGDATSILAPGTPGDYEMYVVDAAGNVSDPSTATLTVDNTSPQLSAAETLDTDNDGKIDHYKLTFNENVDDSTFPGYSQNGTGSTTALWLVSLAGNVKLVHGTAVTFATDTSNDDVLYIVFDENSDTCNASDQLGCDTGAEPNLTLDGAPGLTDTAGNVLTDFSSSLTESDTALPIVVKAAAVDYNHVDITFSEEVDQTTGEIIGNYSISDSLSVTDATKDGDVVHLETDSQSAILYTVTVTNVTDTATNTVNASADEATFTGIELPSVTSVTSTSSTGLTVVFSETMLAGAVGTVTGTGECANSTECSVIYNIPGLTVDSSVSSLGADTDSTTFILTVSEQVEENEYTLTVTNGEVKDSSDGTAIGAVGNTGDFTGDGKPLAAVDGSACVAGSPCYIDITFDQSMNFSAGDSSDVRTALNYNITSCTGGTCGNASQAATNVSYVDGTNTATLTFASELATDGDSLYSITIEYVEDLNGNAISVGTVKTFTCGADQVPPTLVSAEVLSSWEVLLTFSESVTTTSAEVEANYNIDGDGAGVNIKTAIRQANTEQVTVTLDDSTPLERGGHNIVVVNLTVEDLAGNAIDGSNQQPFTMNPPQVFEDGPVFINPFEDGVETGQIFIFNGKLYVGPDDSEGKIFEMSADMNSSQSITVTVDDSDTAPPYTDFAGLDTTGSEGWTTVGIDSFYSACLGKSPSTLTGSDCEGTDVFEANFIGAFISTGGNYDSIWMSTDAGIVRTYTEIPKLETGPKAFRSMSNFVFKNQLYVGLQDQGGGAIKFSRLCANPAGCDNGGTYGGDPIQLEGKNLPRMASDNEAKGNILISIDSMWEHDDDGYGAGDESQLYMANGGYITSTTDLTNGTRSGKWDGGILRTILTKSTTSSAPEKATIATDFEDITPRVPGWLRFMSIALPKDAVGNGVCGTIGDGTTEDWDCLIPQNKITPSIKAVPYMRTAPNGDLYLIRNACSVTTVQTLTSSIHQTCPSGKEVPQLWMLPYDSGAASSVQNAWVLVASSSQDLSGTVTNSSGSASVVGSDTDFTSELSVGDLVTIDGQTRIVVTIDDSLNMTMSEDGTSDDSGLTATWVSGRTDMSGNNTALECDSSPNKCVTENTHITLLEFNGNFLYIGYDNSVYGLNVWRVDFSSIASGDVPDELDFNLVHSFGLGDVPNNKRIFSNVTVDADSVDYLVITTGNGSNAIRVYRTKNEE